MANFFPGAQLPVSQIRLTTAQWSNCGATYTPPLGVLCVDTDTSLAKMGNGSDCYNDLGYFNSGGGTSTGIVLLSSTNVNLNEGTGVKQNLYTVPASRIAIVANVIFHKFSDVFTADYLITLGWDNDAQNMAYILPSVTYTQSGMLNLSVFPTESEPTIYWVPPLLQGSAGQILGLASSNGDVSPLTCLVDVFGYLTNTSGVPQANISTP